MSKANTTANEPPTDSQTDYGVGGHRYNDDLLLAAEARERARQEHEAIFHVLDHEQLRAAFRQENDAANRAKRQSHVAGFWAVAAALAGLAGAASEPLWIYLIVPLRPVIAVASAALGLLSFVVGVGGLLYGKRKAAWLHSRLHTERLRQFHFQSLIWRLPEIAASLRAGEREREDYRAAREQWFSVVEQELKGKSDAQMASLLNPTAAPLPVWLHRNALTSEEPAVPGGADVSLEVVFQAYEVFRFDEQEGYAEYMLRPTNRPEPRKGQGVRPRRSNWLWYPGVNQPLRAKLKALIALWIVALAALVLLHVIVLAAHVGGWHQLEGPWMHVTIVWAALLAVAVKTLSEGFALSREIERYEEYRAVVSSLKRAFREAQSPRRKLQLMIEMEKAAFEEMRVFLRSHHEATFIM
ncbi:MAG TPA: hypothetical protein VK421_17610 [Pyrinomonadaceae bacterium]|nr:hypothetical protein [Pyrinomonadaceae bacterium]